MEIMLSQVKIWEDFFIKKLYFKVTCTVVTFF